MRIPTIEVEYENGYSGRVMVHKPTKKVGMVETVDESDWLQTKLSLKLNDGTVKEGELSDFEDVTGEQRSDFFNGLPSRDEAVETAENFSTRPVHRAEAAVLMRAGK
jgi:hypothetical protein